MKTKITLLFIFLFAINRSFAQQTPLDFSDNLDVFTGFGGTTFAQIGDPSDSNNTIGQFARAAVAAQGMFIDLIDPIDLDVEDDITLRFYPTDGNAHTVVVKLENGTNPDIEVSLSTSSGFVWNDLVFDFSTVSGSGTYNRLTIRIDDGSTVPGAFWFDDINDGSVDEDPNAIDVIYDVLVWEDNFDSGSTPEIINSSNWFHQTYAPQFNPDFGGNAWFNGELQHYTDRMDNSFMQDGELNIILKREDYTPPAQANAASLKYTSARLNSKFSFTYGRVDVRAKLPGRQASWPAIWTLGKNVNETGAYWQTQGFGTTTWPACGEIDIMEHGLHSDNTTSSAIHVPGRSGGNPFFETIGLMDVVNDYHIYSVNWSTNKIVFLVDDVPYYSVTKTQMEAQGGTWVFDLDQYLLLNVAVGGFAGTPDDTDFNDSAMVIDYVKVYQQDNLSLDDNQLAKIKVTPNPANDYLDIMSNNSIDKVEVYSILGQKVIEILNVEKRISTNNLQNGMYVIKVYSGNNVDSQKVIISN